MDKDTMEQFQMLTSMMEKMAANMLTKDDIEPISNRSANKAATLVDQKLGKRIDSPFDDYKLTHEKQYELERVTEALQARVNDLEARLAELENKTAEKTRQTGGFFLWAHFPTFFTIQNNRSHATMTS